MKKTLKASIKEITFDEIFPIWKKHLWIDRKSPVEPYSAIKFNTFPFEYDTSYSNSVPTFYAAVANNKILGVNSGHMAGDGYRSRGLFVLPKYRGNGIGIKLLETVQLLAKRENASYCWSMPKKDSLSTYLRAGFEVTSDFFETETSALNIFVKVNLQG